MAEPDSFFSALSRCSIPPEYSHFGRLDASEDSEIIDTLESFKSRSQSVLRELHSLLELKKDVLSLEEQSEVAFAVAAFDGDDDPWSTNESQAIARDILTNFISPNETLCEEILTKKIKPLFQKNPHPQLNPSTGRKLPRVAGGPLATTDYQEDQVWKKSPGAANALNWTLTHISEGAYERFWHLIVPPVMTLLDDFDPVYKARGAEIVCTMLQRIPKSILKRTGVDVLLGQSLLNCMSFIETESAPRLLKSTIQAHLSLTQVTTESGSSEWFNQLCSLLGDGIIGSVWTYSSNKPLPLLATIEVLPEVIKELGIGSSRYLKVLVTQLVHPLLSEVETIQTGKIKLKLKLASLRSLVCVMEVCKPRISRWKGTILNGLCRCWVVELQAQEQDDDLLYELRRACQLLGKVCPDVSQVEFAQLLELDDRLFRPLLLGAEAG